MNFCFFLWKQAVQILCLTSECFFKKKFFSYLLIKFLVIPHHKFLCRILQHWKIDHFWCSGNIGSSYWWWEWENKYDILKKKRGNVNSMTFKGITKKDKRKWSQTAKNVLRDYWVRTWEARDRTWKDKKVTSTPS